MSRIDIIVPCYGYGHFLRECVSSVLRQSLADLRILIIDDASPDETPEVAAALAAEDARVEVRRHAVNRGHIATYNEGIEWASADYMLLLSADDFLLPGSLERAVSFLDLYPDVGFVYGRWIDYATGEPISIPSAIPGEPPSRVFASGEFIRHLIPENHVATPTAIVRTKLQKELGGYRPHLPHAGDLEMWLRFAVHAPVGALAAYQAAYRRHARNMSIDYYRSVLPDIEQRRAAIAEVFARFEDRIPNRGHLEKIAIRGLAEQTVGLAHAAFDRKDRSACIRCLEYATSLYPDIESSPVWKRLIWKKRLGTTVCSFLHPIARRVRPNTASIGHDPDDALTPRAMARSTPRSGSALSWQQWISQRKDALTQ
jgi:glycosyltransferase involved in cell wall biosynthesis